MKLSFIKKSPPKKLSWFEAKWVVPAMFVLGLAIGGAGVWVGYAFFYKQPAQKVESIVSNPADQGMSEVVTDESSTQTNTSTGVLEPGIVSSRLDLDVEWSEPKLLTRDQVRSLMSASAASMSEVLAKRGENEFVVAENFINIQDFSLYNELSFQDLWKAGTVQSGVDKGGEIYIANFNVMSMGGGANYQYLLKRPGSDRLIAIRQDVIRSIIGDSIETAKSLDVILAVMDFGTDIQIPSLDMPETLTLENGKTLKKQALSWSEDDAYRHEKPSGYYDFAVKDRDGRSLFSITDDESDWYLGCLYAFSPDGLAHKYVSSISAKKVDEYSETPNIRWIAGIKSTEDFDSNVQTGCGGSGCTQIISNDSSYVDDLVAAGTTSDGESVYIPKNFASHSQVKSLYDTWYSPANEKTSIQEFLKKVPVPIFFWKDGLDRWVMYHSRSAAPSVECGKPVIYLYPETKTDIHVSLPKFIDVTVSDPQYPEKGWNVTANPNGDLVSHEDGKTYGSLYWEGTGVSYATPKTGFVVKDGDVESFLAKILPKYGLNEKEAREFMEFWVPEMKGASYYRVSFLTDDWSKSAPLSVYPRPKTSIRIFMDWQPLSSPVYITEPTIITPERNGFTLVEWGGTLYR